MEKLNEGAIYLNDNEVFNNCSYSCYMNIADALNKLKEYEDLEEQGLLIKLPCKAGAIVYEANIKRNIISSFRVTSIVVMTNSRNYNWELIEGIYSNLNGFNEFALGKTIFLIREEAEKALKELKGE